MAETTKTKTATKSSAKPSAATTRKTADSVKKVQSKKADVASPTRRTRVASATAEKSKASDREKVDRAFGATSARSQVPQNREELFDSLIKQLIHENRRNRNWGIFFKLATFVFLFSLLYLLFDRTSDSLLTGGVEMADSSTEFTAVVEVHGIIAPDESAGSDQLISKLRSAFEAQGTRGIILDINSPGGSPVQSGQVFDEIKRLRTVYPDIEVYAAINDLGASGAYYIAAAADQIYADKSSLVGSIGVISSSFGFDRAIEKLGIDRRLVVAGRNKAFLDPFSPEDAELTDFWQSVLNETHKQFIDSVREGRGDRISDNEEIYSGLIYNGEQALELGLVDGLGDKHFVAREIVGYEQLRYFADEEESWLELIRRFGTSLGTAFSRAVVRSLGQTFIH